MPNHPSREELLAYASGKVVPEVLEVLADHVEHCPVCEETLASLGNPADTFVQQLRGPVPPDPYAAEPACERFLDSAKAAGGGVGGRPGSGDSISTQSSDAEAMSPAVEPSPGVGPLELGELGDYRLLAELGHGGMGTVYKALHKKLEKVVALKVLPKGHTADPHAIARFEREMKAVGRVNHPNVVEAHDARDINGTTVLVMEYVEGQDLSQVVKRLGMLPIAEACEIARQTALGLQAAHDHGLVHRDIKPSNLMLTIPPECSRHTPCAVDPAVGTRRVPTTMAAVKILDLGLARLGTEKPGDAELTSSGAAMGTADYMAPEQASDAHTADARADIYSLGCTLYKLLSGQAPFGGPNYPTQMKKMVAHLAEPVPPIRGLRADVPEALAGVMDRMLAKRPEDRISTAAEVAVALAPFAAGADLNRLAAAAAGNADGAALSSPQILTEPFLPSAMSNTTSSRLLPSPPGKGLGGERVNLPSPSGRGAGGEGGQRRIVAVALAGLAAAVVVWLSVITFRTPQGTVVIDVNEKDADEIKVTLQNGDVVRTLPTPSRVGRCRLRPASMMLPSRGEPIVSKWTTTR